MTWDLQRYRALGLVRSGPVGTPPGIAPYRWWREGVKWEVSRMASAFDTALGTAQTEVVGYATTALPIVAAVAVAFLGVKYARRIIGRL